MMTNEMLAKELELTVEELEELFDDALLDEMAEEHAICSAMEHGIALW